jgi:SpoVK/Ycf46/Vps4 family AAA+-type ATPase
LWIDELEKALAGSESGASNDVAIKILGILLTWMQERTAPVFIIATANDISMIRPETYRDGRIDEKFFLGFLEDDIEQIDQILKIHLKKRLKDNYDTVVKQLDTSAIAKKMSQMVVLMGGKDGAGYTGANIEALVEKVLMDRFVRDKETIDTRDFVRMLNKVNPQHGKTIKIMLKHAGDMEAIHA